MIEQNEIVTLFLGVGCVILIILKRDQLRRIPFSSFLLISYFCLFLSFIMTVLETYFWQNLFNLIEHFGYLLSTIFLTAWCWNIARGKKVNI